jgi:hypothetical protein
VHAPLHCSDWNRVCVPDHHVTSVSDRRRVRKTGNLRVRNSDRFTQFVCESAQPGAEHDPDFWAKWCLRDQKLRSGVGLVKRFGRHREEMWKPLSRASDSKLIHNNMPAMLADIRFAMVPANIARMPNLASSPRLFGAREPIPPISIPMFPRLANPHNA